MLVSARMGVLTGRDGASKPLPILPVSAAGGIPVLSRYHDLDLLCEQLRSEIADALEGEGGYLEPARHDQPRPSHSRCVIAELAS